ncbi:MAG: type II toxin-antitoxin system Phd/YefM family antitoxin [Candidatus Binataceae bacterium]
MAKPKAVNKTVNIHEAKTHFSKLLKRVERGDEVIIARAGRPVARICALTPPKLPDRVPGTGKGFFSQEALDRILEPLPEEIQRLFDGEE